MNGYLQLQEYIIRNIDRFADEKIAKCVMISLKNLNESYDTRIPLAKYKEMVKECGIVGP